MRVTHFEVHSAQPEQTIAFYTTVLGWTFTPWGPPGMYWLITTGPEGTPGINGGLVPRRGALPAEGQPVNAYVCTVQSPDVDATVQSAVAAGGSIALPKMGIPGVGWLAYCKDGEGNIFGIMQNDPGAK